MFCGNCGKPLEEGARFCGNCGSRVAEEDLLWAESLRKQMQETEAPVETAAEVPELQEVPAEPDKIVIEETVEEIPAADVSEEASYMEETPTDEHTAEYLEDDAFFVSPTEEAPGEPEIMLIDETTLENGVPVEETVIEEISEERNAEATAESLTEEAEAESEEATAIAEAAEEEEEEEVQGGRTAGWVIAVRGAHTGQSYTVCEGRNYIGEASGNAIRLKGENGVAAEKQACILYDPKKGNFILIPGETRELTYLNDELVMGPELLKAGDLIEVGEALLYLYPFTKEGFSWDNF